MAIRISDNVITREIPVLTMRELIDSERQLGRAELVDQRHPWTDEDQLRWELAELGIQILASERASPYTEEEQRWFRGPAQEGCR